MVRGLSDAILLFLLPFVGYAMVLALRRRFPSTIGAFTRGPMLRLVAAGLALAIAGTLLGGIFAERYKGDYMPAHLENGVLVPGRMSNSSSR